MSALGGEAVVASGVSRMHKQCTRTSKPLVQQTIWTAGAETGPTVDRRPPTLVSLGLLAMTGVDTRVFGVHRRDPSPPPRPRDRDHLLEEWLSRQERTTAFLLHQAFQNKDDIISCLQGRKGYQHRETSAQRLLENHVQTITSIVKKLGQDIEVMHAEEHFPCSLN